MDLVTITAEEDGIYAIILSLDINYSMLDFKK